MSEGLFWSGDKIKELLGLWLFLLDPVKLTE